MNRPTILAAFAALIPAVAIAADYSEAVDGDLSNVPASPTMWTLDAGPNTLTGAAGFQGAGFDFDIVSFTIPANHQLDSIAIVDYVNESAGFMGLQNGTPWLTGVGGQLRADHLIGWSLFGYGSYPPELLADLHLNAGNPPKFSIPLAAGVYTLEIQDIDTPLDYTLQFNVSAIGGGLTPGDFDGMNGVNGDDLLKWQADFGNEGSDADGDDDSDGNDFLIWQRNLGLPSTTAVPEPAGVGTALAALTILALRGRRQRQR
jgi:hypothetical protein